MRCVNIDLTPLKAWIGRREVLVDPLPTFSAAALSVTLDRDDAPATGDALPALWHWVYFLNLDKTADLTENGHAAHGGFLPPMPLPRRMFAGARLRFHRPLRLGERARRVSTIADVRLKQGASGDLVFLLVRNEFDVGGELALVEEQDIVYRAPAEPGATGGVPRRAPTGALWVREFTADEKLLFRYSALIFNAHRIHWDRPYTQHREGYPGLIVHGQLIATLLADLVRRHTDRPIVAFRFRSVSALFEHTRCRLCGVPRADAVTLWAEGVHGDLVMEAHAELGDAQGA